MHEELKMCHLNVNPTSILYNHQNGRFVLGGLFYSRNIQIEKHEKEVKKGKLQFQPAELLQMFQKVDQLALEQCDVFSLGITLLHLVNPALQKSSSDQLQSIVQDHFDHGQLSQFEIQVIKPMIHSDPSYRTSLRQLQKLLIQN